MMTAMSDDTRTALTGTRWLLTFDHSRPPGTAPSRLNANIIREQLVRHEVVQYSWPIVEISMTILNAPLDSAVAKMPVTAKPSTAELLTASGLCTANRKASSRIQPPMAE